MLGMDGKQTTLEQDGPLRSSHKSGHMTARSKRVGTNTLRHGAGVCWTWDMDMPDLPVIETQDTHKIGRKGLWRPRAELRDGSVTRDRAETTR